ncbi:MAG: tRNA adenosine(34) deaminase TadA [Clostridia bacterium]|nr:tRNA adenosine(34) deaminase TadA [Clostridia bacterium]
MDDNFFMKKALAQAKAAFKDEEAPIGAVIVKDGEVIARARNTREKKANALCHAEITAIDRACKKLGSWRLNGCELYVTLEPCAMCAGAIINARIKRVVFGAYDQKAGSFGSVVDLNALPYNHHPEVVGGVMQEECSEMLSSFFKGLRDKAKRISEKQEKQAEE